FEDDRASVSSASTSKPKTQVPYRAKSYGPAVSAYRSSFRHRDGAAAIPGVLDHQRRADHFIQREKTQDATASYTAKFNTTYNVTQGSATPPTAENVAATLVQVETTEKIAAYELSQHQKLQEQENQRSQVNRETLHERQQEKNPRFQHNRETLHERLNRIEEKLVSLDGQLTSFDKRIQNLDRASFLYNNYFAEIGTDNEKTARSIRRANEAIHLVFEELSESVTVLDQVAKAAKIETYESVIDEKGLRKLIGKKPVYKESKGKEPAYQRGCTTQADGHTIITDAATGKPVDNPEEEDEDQGEDVYFLFKPYFEHSQFFDC
ncbi:hypothetical protein HDU76_011581, partial [Blyttiomyces sp. JEL0837]